MFCEKCGKEVREEWNQCPYCSNPLKTRVKEAENRMEIPKFESRSDLKRYLTEHAWEKENRSVVAFYGSYAISGDLIKVLNPGEIPEEFIDGYEKTVFSFLKRLRFFRNYIVCTNQRVIYYETGRKIFKLLPFLRKVKSFPYCDIKEVRIEKYIGLYSGGVSIALADKEYSFYVLNIGSAERLKNTVDGK